MKMHILSGGRLQMKRHIYFPDAPREEWIELPVNCFLFRHAQGNVLFDTGCHPRVNEDPADRWGEMAKHVVPIMSADDHLLNSLNKAGLGPEDIDVVVNSHLHLDHCGCNEFFTNATVYAHKDEVAAARASEGQGYFAADWDHPMPMVEIEGETDLFDDSRLVLLPLPGHTPGMTGMLATLPEGGEYLLTSDAAPTSANLEREVIPKNMLDKDRTINSYAEIKRIKAGGAKVYYGHDVEQWRLFRVAGEPYT